MSGLAETKLHWSGFIAVTCSQQQQPALTVVSSVAAAYHCAMGDDFGGVTFEQSAMRRHLIECFEHWELSAFPLALGAVNRNPQILPLMTVSPGCLQPIKVTTLWLKPQTCFHSAIYAITQYFVKLTFSSSCT